jgi:hypothetical protein
MPVNHVPMKADVGHGDQPTERIRESQSSGKGYVRSRTSVASVAARNRAIRAIVIIAGLLISAGSANAITCQSSPVPSNKGQWAWRLIDNKKCWYAGEPGMDKSKLHWAVNADRAPEPTQRVVREPARLSALQPALRSEPAPSTEAQRSPAIPLPARAGDIDWSNRWPGINSEPPAISIPAGSDAAGTESHASLQPAGDDSRRTNLAFSSYAKSRATAEAPQPMRARADAAKRKSAAIKEFGSQAAFSFGVFTVALAIAMLLFGMILKFARQANTHDRRRAAEAWLQAFHQRRTNLEQRVGRRSDPRMPDNSVSKSPPIVPADDLESGLRDLICDLCPTEIAGEEPQTLASTAGYDVPRRSYLRVMKVGEGPAMGAQNRVPRPEPSEVYNSRLLRR